MAPVAGFSQDQQNAFGTVRGAQGMAQPYINQAQNYFSPQGTQDFLNPYAANVMAGLKDVFGQQASQNTGQLTQAAGGVGADRIAVGQSELAKQQDLSAGQTLSGLYNNAVQQAQSAGYGTAALGSQAQNAALSGAQAQLGTGGLQQQLQQAQLNAPYQWDLARLAYPFQTAQFNAGITGALAPGLGGTTSGVGTNFGNATPAQPSIYSQILGAGTAAAGIYGGLNGGSGGKGSSPAYGGNGVYGGDSGNPLPGLSASDYGSGFARGGTSPFYDEGGSVYDLPAAFNDKPINIDAQSLVPSEKLQPIQSHQPTLNLTPPAASSQPQGGGGPNFGDIAKTALQIGMMFAARGGRIGNPFATGGATDTSFERISNGDPAWGDPDVGSGYAMPVVRSPFEERGRFRELPPARKVPVKAQGYASGGDTDVINPDEPFRMPDAAAVRAWRDEIPAEPLAFAGNDSTASPYAPRGRAAARNDAGLPPVITGAPQSEDASADAIEDSSTIGDFAKSPWAALTAAGLGMMAGTSPFAGVNIGQGGLQGVKTLAAQREAAQKDTTIAQAAKRLAQEAKFHEDAYNRETVGQKNTREEAARPYSELTAAQKATQELNTRKQQLEELKPVNIGTDFLGHPVMARRDPETGQYISAITGKPIDPSSMPGGITPQFNIPGQPESSNDDATLPPHAQVTEGITAPQGVNREVLASLPAGLANKIKSVDEGRISIAQAVGYKDRSAFVDYLSAYDPSFDATTWTLRNRQQAEMSTAGNAGKMILAVNQLLPHLKTASDKAAALQNGDFKGINAIVNWAKEQTGSALPGNFETVREVAAMDAARLLRGSGQMSEKDIDFWRHNLGTAGSPEQLQEKINLLADDLMGARISSIQHSYRTNMRMEPPDFISKEAKEALATIKQRSSATAKPAAAPTVAPTAAGTAPDAAEKPATVTQNGHVYNLQPDGSYK